jgi:predicted aspartyl protease
VSAAGQSLSDPFQILDRYFAASGGLERLRAETGHHALGTLKVAGLTGSIEVWAMAPDRSLAVVDLGILKITQGDNGEAEWVVDSNGKLQVITNFDEAKRLRKEIHLGYDSYNYVDPGSTLFTVQLAGTDSIDSRPVYVVKIANARNDDVRTLYIDTVDFLLRKLTDLEAEGSSETYPGDYRAVDGIMVPFYTKEIALQTGQEQEILLTSYESNPALDLSIFDPPEPGGRDYRFVQGDRSENVPFRLLENHLYIPVIVNCLQRYWILDTGAAVSVISKTFADELGLTPEGDMKGAGAGGTVQIEFATLPPFTVPGIEFDEQVVAVIDMTELDRLLPVEAVGILGYDFLSRFVTRIDYANQVVSFYDPATFTYTGNGQQIDAHIEEGVFAVTATLDGGHTGIWLFDIGASGSSLETEFAQKNGYTGRKGIEGLGRGAANEFKSSVIRTESLEFAGHKIDRPLMSYRSDVKGEPQRTDKIGTLGNTFFRNFVIYCDYANERLFIEQGAEYNVEPPLDRSGLQLRRTVDGQPEVMFVSGDTPAARAGMQIGDRLLAVNGISVAHMDGLKAVRALFREKAGTEYSLSVDRNGQQKEIRIKLADLL